MEDSGIDSGDCKPIFDLTATVRNKPVNYCLSYGFNFPPFTKKHHQIQSRMMLFILTSFIISFVTASREHKK